MSLGDDSSASKIAESIVANPARFTIIASVKPVCAALHQWLSTAQALPVRPAALDCLIAHATDTVRERVQVALPVVKDWSIQWRGCACMRTCCRQAKDFLKDPSCDTRVFKGPDATWSGHLTKVLEAEAVRSGEFHVQRVSSKAAYVNGILHVTKNGVGRTATAEVRRVLALRRERQREEEMLRQLEAMRAPL